MSRSSVRLWLPLIAIATGCSSDPATDQDRFDQLVSFSRAELARQRVPGAAVAVVVDGEVRFSAGVGTKALGTDDPVHAETMFGIGSTTKMLTAAGLLALQDRGTLDLDDPVVEHVTDLQLAEGFEVWAGEITLRQLLSHTSGLPDLVENLCAQDLGGHWAGSRPPLWSDPGLLHNYSNSGYSLAGLAVERAAGKPFAEAMRELVFDGAGMPAITFDAAAAMALDHSHGHRADGEGNLVPFELDSHGCAYMMPSGNQTYVSAPELAHFAATVMGGGGEMLSRGAVAEILETPVDSHGFPGERYGLGLASLERPGVRVLSHGGNDNRFAAEVAFAPERRFGVVVLMNSGTGVPVRIAAEALRIFIGDGDGLVFPHIERGEQHPAASSLPRYAGTYLDPFQWGRAVVTVEGDRLVADLVDVEEAPRAVLWPTGGDAFVAVSEALASDLGLYFSFEGDPTKAARIVTRLGVFTRVPDAPEITAAGGAP
jgi:CubicO group peptidase (beta-lactamase class C family)